MGLKGPHSSSRTTAENCIIAAVRGGEVRRPLPASGTIILYHIVKRGTTCHTLSHCNVAARSKRTGCKAANKKALDALTVPPRIKNNQACYLMKNEKKT